MSTEKSDHHGNNEQAEEKPEAAASGDQAGQKTRDSAELPEPQFAHIIETFAVQAMIYLGKIINPITNKYEEDLGMARYQIGILEMLEAKTKGNLLSEESHLLEELLHTTRLAYYDVSRRPKPQK
jgi:hypothetical protein